MVVTLSASAPNFRGTSEGSQPHKTGILRLRYAAAHLCVRRRCRQNDNGRFSTVRLIRGMTARAALIGTGAGDDCPLVAREFLGGVGANALWLAVGQCLGHFDAAELHGRKRCLCGGAPHDATPLRSGLCGSHSSFTPPRPVAGSSIPSPALCLIGFVFGLPILVSLWLHRCSARRLNPPTAI